MGSCLVLIFQDINILWELAPGLNNQAVAGFHRAHPSTSLDKVSISAMPVFYHSKRICQIKSNQKAIHQLPVDL
jgi:hypothetical protein